MTMADSTMLGQLLQQTLEAGTRKQGIFIMMTHIAEQQLQTAENNPGFSLKLLEVVNNAQLDSQLRFAAALYFKNFIKRNWTEENNKISAVDRQSIKSGIVNLMLQSPEKCQVQLSEAVSFVAQHEFPQNWESLIADLVTALNPVDYKVNLGVLQTAHSIFKRYRHEFRSDALFTEIKFVLGQFCDPFLQLFQNTDRLITENQNNPEALKLLFNSMHLICKIFLSLNSQDIPEFFEDHQEQFMPIFLKYLSYQNPALQTDDDDEEAGPLEKLKTSICEIADLYAKKYEEVFTALPKFVESIWHLLVTTSLSPKYDLLVSIAITFLSSVVKHARHKQMFESPDALKSICEKILLPNMQLRQSDEELFEDDPMEYIRRDLEGSDSDTRRRSATDFIRSLNEQFEAALTALFGEYLNHFLNKYNSQTAQNWKDKDTAIYLLMAITAKAATTSLGATKTNTNINIPEIFSQHILGELQTPIQSPHPFLKVDALKFLNIFRHHLSKEQLVSVFPLVVSHLTSKNYVVYTYAAVCIERILNMKTGTGFLFTPADLAPFTEQLLGHLFTLIESGQTPEKMSENDYLIRTVMRVIYIARQDMAPYVNIILQRLTKVLENISRNPSNPKFNHYVFESIGSLIRFICNSNPALVTEFEKLLFGPIQAILQLDIPEFTPYVLQILSQLLEYHTETTIPAPYQPLLPPLLLPNLWDSHGNIPALVRLLQAYLQRGAVEIVQNKQLPSFLGIFQKLIASKTNDQFGFELLLSIFSYVPLDALQPFIVQIFNIMLMRLQSSKTSKYTSGFLRFIGHFICSMNRFNSSQLLIETLDSIQPKLFSMVFTSICLPEIPQVTSSLEKKVLMVALIKLMTETPKLWTSDHLELIAKLLEETIKLIQSPLQKEALVADEDEIFALDAEEAGYQSVFVRLHSISKAQKEPTADIPDVSAYFKEKISKLAQTQSQFAVIRQKISPESQTFMSKLGL